MEHCGEFWVFGTKISDGMNAEIIHAKKMGIQIKLFDDTCLQIGALERELV